MSKTLTQHDVDHQEANINKYYDNTRKIRYIQHNLPTKETFRLTL